MKYIICLLFSVSSVLSAERSEPARPTRPLRRIQSHNRRAFWQLMRDWASSPNRCGLEHLGRELLVWVDQSAPYLSEQVEGLKDFLGENRTWLETLKGGGWRATCAEWNASEGTRGDRVRRKLVGKFEELTLQLLSAVTGRSKIGSFETVGTRGYKSDIDTAFSPDKALNLQERVVAKQIFDGLFCHLCADTPGYLIDTECFVQQVGQSLDTEAFLMTPAGRALFAQEQIQASLIQFRQSLAESGDQWLAIRAALLQRAFQRCPKKMAALRDMLDGVGDLYRAMQQKRRSLERSSERQRRISNLTFSNSALQLIYSKRIEPFQGRLAVIDANQVGIKSAKKRADLCELSDLLRVQQALFGSLAESCTKGGYISQGAFRVAVINRGGQRESWAREQEMLRSISTWEIQTLGPGKREAIRCEVSTCLDRFISSLENYFQFEAHLARATKFDVRALQKALLEESKYAKRSLSDGILTCERLLNSAQLSQQEKYRLRANLTQGLEKLAIFNEIEQVKRRVRIPRRTFSASMFPLLCCLESTSKAAIHLARIPSQETLGLFAAESRFVLHQKVAREIAKEVALDRVWVSATAAKSKEQPRELPLVIAISPKDLSLDQLKKANLLALAFAGIPWNYFCLADANIWQSRPFDTVDLSRHESLSANLHEALFAEIADVVFHLCELDNWAALAECREQLRDFHINLLVDWIAQFDLCLDGHAPSQINPRRAWDELFHERENRQPNRSHASSKMRGKCLIDGQI